jgi:hypothetical protein
MGEMAKKNLGDVRKDIYFGRREMSIPYNPSPPSYSILYHVFTDQGNPTTIFKI